MKSSQESITDPIAEKNGEKRSDPFGRKAREKIAANVAKQRKLKGSVPLTDEQVEKEYELRQRLYQLDDEYERIRAASTEAEYKRRKEAWENSCLTVVKEYQRNLMMRPCSNDRCPNTITGRADKIYCSPTCRERHRKRNRDPRIQMRANIKYLKYLEKEGDLK